MDKPMLKTGAGPYSTRQYVYLLICLTLLMTAITTGFIYWQSNKFKKIEMLANEYHLSTMLNCVRIKEEAWRIQSHAYELLAEGEPAKRWIYGHHFNLGRSFFIIKEKIDIIRALQRHHNHQEYANTLKNADNLLSRLLAVEENIDFAEAADVDEISKMLHQLDTFMDQLQRLHTIAYKALMSDLLLERPQVSRNTLLFLFSLGIIGFLVIGKILNLIRLAEEQLAKHRQHLQELVEERTSELTEANEKLKQEITERKQAEEEKDKLQAQLAQAQKIEAIGTLAGGIAHNFNNLLMGIMGNTSLMLLETDSTHPNYERLKTIEKSIRSGSNLTRQLLGYARKGGYEIKPISLNQLVKDTSNTFGTTKKEIRVHRELAKDLFGIKADRGQIEQTLMNLYVNASDAMPGGGDLFLKTMNVIHEDMKGKPYKPNPGNYVLLTVRDTGVGMDRKTLERIFDPFFTTKGLAKGTGLGLASVYGIVKAHGGYIDVESKRGHGTTFKIYIPASKKETERIEEKDLSEKILKGKETVLFVDDEDMVIDVGEQMLKKLGYEVLLARGGREALELYKKNRNKIDMVILDMVMPDMGGGEAYDRLKEINSDANVLLSSGYSIDGQAEEILERGCDAFIQKPFNLEELSEKIREILDRK